MDIQDLIIVGAGPAGLAASIYALERKLKVSIVEATKPGGQLTNLYPDKDVYDYLSYTAIKARTLAQKMYEHALAEGAVIQEGKQISEIKKNEVDFILTDGNEELVTKSVLLATGMGHYQPRLLQVPGEEEFKDKGLWYQKLPDRVVGKRVIVIGGGDTALETAVAATEKGAAVTLVHRSPEFRALEKTIDRARLLSLPTYMSAQVIAIHGNEKVDSVEIIKAQGSRSFLSADLVVICAGIELHNTFLVHLGVKIDRQAIVVDSDEQTNIPGIFACGDLTVPSGKYKRISIAVGSAATAVNGVYQYLKNPYWGKK